MRQLPFPSPGDLPDSGTEPSSPALAGRFFTSDPPGKQRIPCELYLLSVYSDLLSISKINIHLRVFDCLILTKLYHFFCLQLSRLWGFSGNSVVKNLLANAGAAGNSGSIPGSGRSPGGGNGKPLHYSCLENSMDRGAWQATVHGIAKSWKPLSH